MLKNLEKIAKNVKKKEKLQKKIEICEKSRKHEKPSNMSKNR